MAYVAVAEAAVLVLMAVQAVQLVRVRVRVAPALPVHLRVEAQAVRGVLPPVLLVVRAEPVADVVRQDQRAETAVVLVVLAAAQREII
jgi:hypothetical protein